MGETIQALGISWPKLIGQTINFAIVLFVLWRWAYRPVLALLEERRQKIAESIESAERIKAELAKAETTRMEIVNQANQQANQLIVEARSAAARIYEQETQKAITTAEQIIAKSREATEQDRARMLEELRREIGRLVVETTAKVSGKVLTMEDQQRLAAETTKELAA
jgi:F-type H+-transporting ATPase subunit b